MTVNFELFKKNYMQIKKPVTAARKEELEYRSPPLTLPKGGSKAGNEDMPGKFLEGCVLVMRSCR